MQYILHIFPFFISCYIGWAIIGLILHKYKISSLMHLCLGMGLGLGINGETTFISFLLLKQFNQYFVIIFNTAIAIILAGLQLYKRQSKQKQNHIEYKGILKNKKEIIEFVILFTILIPLLYIQNIHYPYGGWDAWSVWNLKARFLFLAKDNWQDIFSPILWRSSPHYPILLPLINVWGWSLLSQPSNITPAITATIFTFISMGLLFSMLKPHTNLILLYLTIIAIITNPLFLKLASSQYCDIVLGYYLLATISCLIMAKQTKETPFCFLTGLFTGILSFTKPEGLISAGILFLLYIPYLVYQNKRHIIYAKKITFKFIAGLSITSIIPAIFYIIYAPTNITFENKILSMPLLEILFRIRAIFYSYFMNLININQWHGLLLFLFILLIAHQKKASDRYIIIIPIYLMIYMGIISFYYFINTYFEINWWLNVTLDRIIFALLPTITLWILYSTKERT